MKDESQNGGDRAIVLVEPSAAFGHGHYRDKLNLWISGFRERGYRAVVATAEPLNDWEGAEAQFTALPGFLLRIGGILPNGVRQYFLMSCCYAMAIRMARRRNCCLVGLSTRGALPLYGGSILAGFRVPEGWATCVMEYREEKLTGPLQRLAFRRASRNGCHFLFNLPQNYERLKGQVAEGKGRFSPDPILVTATDRNRKVEPRPFETFIISGLDNDRRDSMQLASETTLEERIPRLRLHYLGDDAIDAGRFEGLAEEVEHCNRYYFGDEFSDLFRTSDALIISYGPRFAAGSGNLVNAIVCGTPVIASRFQAAIAISEMYGRIGEFFDYGDREGFAQAIGRLRAWKSGEWSEFGEAREAILRNVDYRAVAARVEELVGAS